MKHRFGWKRRRRRRGRERWRRSRHCSMDGRSMDRCGFADSFRGINDAGKQSCTSRTVFSRLVAIPRYFSTTNANFHPFCRVTVKFGRNIESSKSRCVDITINLFVSILDRSIKILRNEYFVCDSID